MKFREIKYFYPEKPVLMLQEADSFQEMSDDDNWVAEPKYNGSRCLVHIFNGKVEFWDRHGKHLKYNSDSLNEEGRENLIVELRKLFGYRGYHVLDGELRHNKVTGIRNKLVIYDIHVHNNEFLNYLTFHGRRCILDQKFGEAKPYLTGTVTLIKQFDTDFKKVFNDYVMGFYGDPDEFEGIVIKHWNGKLRLGRASGTDSTWMFKVRKQTGRHRY